MNILQHTHNLQILIVDEENNVINNETLLEEIYSEFANKHIMKPVEMFDQDFIIYVYWEIKSITKIQKHLMGPLFIASMHSDKVLYEFTKILLGDIETKIKNKQSDKNWKIAFHISKLLDI